VAAVRTPRPPTNKHIVTSDEFVIGITNIVVPNKHTDNTNNNALSISILVIILTPD
jgi:hypothetical protein